MQNMGVQEKKVNDPTNEKVLDEDTSSNIYIENDEDSEDSEDLEQIEVDRDDKSLNFLLRMCLMLGEKAGNVASALPFFLMMIGTKLMLTTQGVEGYEPSDVDWALVEAGEGAGIVSNFAGNTNLIRNEIYAEEGSYLRAALFTVTGTMKILAGAAAITGAASEQSKNMGRGKEILPIAPILFSSCFALQAFAMLMESAIKCTMPKYSPNRKNIGKGVAKALSFAAMTSVAGISFSSPTMKKIGGIGVLTGISTLALTQYGMSSDKVKSVSGNRSGMFKKKPTTYESITELTDSINDTTGRKKVVSSMSGKDDVATSLIGNDDNDNSLKSISYGTNASE